MNHLTPQDHVNLARRYLLCALGTKIEPLAREYLRIVTEKAKREEIA